MPCSVAAGNGLFEKISAHDKKAVPSVEMLVQTDVTTHTSAGCHKPKDQSYTFSRFPVTVGCNLSVLRTFK